MSKTYLFYALLSLAIAIGLSGCASIGYYGQSVIGHSKLMLARQSVDKLIPKSDQPLKGQLELSQQLRQFASQELGLPDSKSYRSYVALKREYPVWNVIAAAEFSLDAKQWCYPVIGCASYRGYFKKTTAQRYAKKLRQQGLETMVGGASAYSTLGWFSDPLLPSMMRYGDDDFAETLFHELAHQKLYINGDSEFNEAFATVVGEVGAARWLAAVRPQKSESYRQSLRAREQFYSLIQGAKRDLSAIYQSAMPDSSKQSAKQAAFAQLNANYEKLKREHWGGKPLFDAWFNKELNNARLAAFSTYREQVPSLLSLLADCEDDLDRFYHVVATSVKVDGKVQVPKSCD